MTGLEPMPVDATLQTCVWGWTEDMHHLLHTMWHEQLLLILIIIIYNVYIKMMLSW